jgi:hypothetical protein
VKNMPRLEDIIKLLRDSSGVYKITDKTDIFCDIGLTEVDFHEFMEKYAITFNVDMNQYLWYFHSDEEGSGNSIGGMFYAPPYRLVKRIPITPKMLFDFAIKGKWDLEYPKHNPPKKRYDLLINKWFVIGLAAFFLALLLIKLIK